MILPSLHEIRKGMRDTLLRFPLVILDAVIATAAALVVVNREDPTQPSILIKILFAGILGIPLLTSLSLLVEKRQWKNPAGIGVQLSGVILLVLYAISFPLTLENTSIVHIERFFMLLAGTHLFVAFAPFSSKGEMNGFWQYNRAMFLRFLLSGLYSGVLFVGLVLALVSIDNLFDFTINPKRYAELWLFLAGIFNTWFFLAGVPRDLPALEEVTEYPKSLKIFSQNILFPLVFVYLVILYLYLGKIVIAWSWPQGWVTALILGFSSVGIFSLLLLHPLLRREKEGWLAITSRWFYIIMIPLVVMLFLALWRRITEYGFTEPRMIGLILGVWLAAISVYFIVSRSKSIKVIPASLCLIAVVMAIGPWSIFSISEHSQANHLKALLEKNGMLVNGKTVKPSTPISTTDADRMKSILWYFHRDRAYDDLQPYFSFSLRADATHGDAPLLDPESIIVRLGINYTDIMFGAKANTAYDISGYERLLPMQDVHTFRSGRSGSETHTFPDIQFTASENLDTLIFTTRGINQPADSLKISIRPLIGQLLKDNTMTKYEIPAATMHAEGENDRLKIRLYFDRLSVKRLDTTFVATSYAVQVLYTLRR